MLKEHTTCKLYTCITVMYIVVVIYTVSNEGPHCTNLFLHDKDYKTLVSAANCTLNKLSKWLNVNKLSLNLSKTCYSVFSKTNVTSDCCRIVMNGVEISRVKSCKYLGIFIDDDLNFDVHIQHLYSKLIKFVGMFYKLALRLPKYYLKNLYFAFINSQLAYGVEIYANTSKKSLHKLHILNNKLLRILQKQPLLTPVGQLYSNYCTLPIHLLHKHWFMLHCFIQLSYLKCIRTTLLLIELFIVMIPDKEMICIFGM